MHPRFLHFPWQRDYVAQSNVFAPYVMALSRPDYQSGSLNIDAHGFRVQYDAHGNRIDLLKARERYHACTVLLGNSTSFGVSASADNRTASHYLSTPDVPCINLSVRGATLHQELALFQTFKHLLPPVRRVVLLTGICDVALATQPEDIYSSEVGGLHSYQTFHERYLEHYDTDTSVVASARRAFHVWAGERYARSAWLQRWFEKRATAMPQVDARRDVAETFDAHLSRLLALTDNVLETWSWMQSATGTPVEFILQPVIGWTSKPLTWVESACLDADRMRVPVLDLYTNAAIHARVREHFDEACTRFGLRFIDANGYFDTLDADAGSMFTDICHLTDAGTKNLGEWMAHISTNQPLPGGATAAGTANRATRKDG